MQFNMARRMALLGLVLLFVSFVRLGNLPLWAAHSPVRLSQVYGGGGNAGATWKADFVELFNASETPWSLEGWIIEYASADGDQWRQAALPALTIPAYGYILVELAAGNSGEGSPLPTPDAVGSLNLNASAGKVRLVDNVGQVMDIVGYGNANQFEGTAPVAELANNKAAVRKEAGCVDTEQNSNDFAIETPAPRNSSTSPWLCTTTSTQTPLPSGTATMTVTVAVTASPTVTPTTVLTTPAPLPVIYISEFLADPAAVDDAYGEWIELHNLSNEAVNLRGWILADHGRDQHVIQTDVWVQAGGYAVVARNGDPVQNGGVVVQYIYSGVALANSDDELTFSDPDGRVVDSVIWGAGSGISVQSGRSLYRNNPQAGWQTADAPWSGSAGDWGHPGAPSNADTPTPDPAYTPTVTATPTATTTPPPLFKIFISEIMADPDAVNDSVGEWFELFNPEPEAVNLNGWHILDEARDSHTIDTDLWINSGAYLVLARVQDPAQNGGVNVGYSYSGLTLANSEDVLMLVDSLERPVDRVGWGSGTVLTVRPGASLERLSFEEVAQWQIAHSAWPGSLGDRGSPGGPPVPAAVVTITPTATPSPKPTRTPTATRTPSPIPTRPPAVWSQRSTVSPLQIEEVYFYGSGDEFVVLLNASSMVLDLTGWRIGDAHFPGSGEGMHRLPDGYLLGAGALFIIARNGSEFFARWGEMPHAQLEESTLGVPVLTRQRELATGSLALNNSGDEVILLDPQGQLADAVAYGDGDWAAIGLSAALPTLGEASLQRIPGFAFPQERDPRQQFLWAAPSLTTVVSRPESRPNPPYPLPDHHLGLWGTLGVPSLFTPAGSAPPHWIEWAAAAHGLHFLAIADAIDPAQRPSTAAPVLSLSAWRHPYHDAVIYGPFAELDNNPISLFDFLSATGAMAQWPKPPLPAHAAVVAVDANSVQSPADLWSFWKDRPEDPPLVVGRTLPPIPGYLHPAPRYTGLAVRTADIAGVTEALRAHRGWLTTQPGLAITLRTEDSTWMGSAIAAGEVILLIDYADTQAGVAGLSIWQDGIPIRQLDLPITGQTWRVAVPAPPGAVLYAVATQPDGDFAVTAPLRVLPNQPTQIWINEVLPVPLVDFNGDGLTDTGDEYVELFNAGPAPISLAGWHLEDRPLETPHLRRRFQLGPQHYLPVGGHLLIWSRESGIGLNNSRERVELSDAQGVIVDYVEWERSPGANITYSRVPNGATWRIWSPTPGQDNGVFVVTEPSPTPPPWAVAKSAAPGTPGGEAVSTLGSVTQAKLAGLEQPVRFTGIVVAPPGLFNATIYVADPAPPPNQQIAWLGVQVYLQNGSFPALQEGDLIEIRGVMRSFRGEREIRVARPEAIWRIGPGTPLLPLPVTLAEIGEPLEGRLVTLEGVVSGWQGNSIFLNDPANPETPSVEVHVRSSLPWRRPYVNVGERWRVIGIVSQFARSAPWNGGYRLLVRFESDLVELP